MMGTFGCVPETKFTGMDTSYRRPVFAEMLAMYVAELACSGRVSMAVFQMLFAGNDGQPPIVGACPATIPGREA